MLKRDCPKCLKHDLRIPLVSEWYICNSCSTIFTLSVGSKWLYRLVFGIFSMLVVFGLVSLLVSGTISLLSYAALVYLGLPFFGSLCLKLYCMYFGRLKGPSRAK